jgi:hypothetical protein
MSAKGAKYDSQGQATKERRPWIKFKWIQSHEKGEIREGTKCLKLPAYIIPACSGNEALFPVSPFQGWARD